MAISRAQLMKELVPGLNGVIGLSYNDYPKEFTQIFEVNTSSRSFEEEVKLAGFGQASQKEEGTSVTYDEGAGEVFIARYTPITWSLGYSLTEEAIEDNLYESLGKRYSKELGRSMAKTKEINHANILNTAFNSAYPGGDGVALCGVHPTKSGLTNTNFSGIGTDLNEATLENAVIAISGWYNERGMLIAAKPRKLVVPVGLQFVATRILKTTSRPHTSDNDVNALRETGAIPEGYMISHYMTDPDAWFLLTDVPDGLKTFQRTSLKVSNEGDFDTGNMRFKARERYAAGWTDPLGLWGSQGAT